jgi:hypothetical protein
MYIATEEHSFGNIRNISLLRDLLSTTMVDPWFRGVEHKEDEMMLSR